MKEYNYHHENENIPYCSLKSMKDLHILHFPYTDLIQNQPKICLHLSQRLIKSLEKDGFAVRKSV